MMQNEGLWGISVGITAWWEGGGEREREREERERE